MRRCNFCVCLFYVAIITGSALFTVIVIWWRWYRCGSVVLRCGGDGGVDVVVEWWW